MIYLKDKKGKLFDTQFRELSLKLEDITIDAITILSYEKEYLKSLLYEKYSNNQKIVFKGPIDIAIPLSGDKFVCFQKIIDRAICGSASDIQEYQFELEDGSIYYTKLSNFFWVKLFGDVPKYSAANRRLKLSIESLIDNFNADDDINILKQKIELLSEPIVVEIDKLIASLAKDSTIPSEFLTSMNEAKDNLFKKVDVDSALSDIEELRSKYSL